jgi:hypothetical protein
MNSPRLKAYLAMEAAILHLDSEVEKLRDALDPIWHGLSAEERAFLNARGDIKTIEARSAYPTDAVKTRAQASLGSAAPAPGEMTREAKLAANRYYGKKLSGGDRRLLHTLLKGKTTDAHGTDVPKTSCEERILRLIADGYVEMSVTEKAIDELAGGAS